MQIPHQTYKIDLNSINEPLTRMIESVNDKGVRYVDVELWANSQKVTLPQNCTATAAFVTDGFLINESVECSISDDLTTVIVPIDNANIESKSGIMLVEIKITDENSNVLTPPFAFKVRVKKSITEDANIFEKSYGTVSEILKEVAAARGDFNNLNARFDTKADKATTLAGYSITDGENTANKTDTVDVINASSKKYVSEQAIKNFYSKYVSNKLIDEDGSVDTYNIADKAVTADKLADEVKTIINSKYDSSNVETGRGSLTPYTANTAIASTDFEYIKVGKMLTITIKVNFTAGKTSNYHALTGLPFKIINLAKNGYAKTITNASRDVIYYVEGSWLIIRPESTTSNPYVNNENLIITLTYKIQ